MSSNGRSSFGLRLEVSCWSCKTGLAYITDRQTDRVTCGARHPHDIYDVDRCIFLHVASASHRCQLITARRNFWLGSVCLPIKARPNFKPISIQRGSTETYIMLSMLIAILFHERGPRIPEHRMNDNKNQRERGDLWRAGRRPCCGLVTCWPCSGTCRRRHGVPVSPVQFIHSFSHSVICCIKGT